ncbi:MAG: alpha/beta fold hydrolase [Sphingomonadales bacterium]|nr:alpha/beta fold hydrolase [Sphingomonadales bacterium]MDE2569374.1 alpha/beta fold hydrolase [Sphingomonadales bacterium]
MIGVAGRRLRIGEWNADAGPGGTAPRPLLLLGGIGINMEMIEPLAMAMSERRVISLDMPGVGRSPDPIFPYTMACMALTCAALLDRLEIARADVLGISWGGALAQQFAFQHRARTGSLVLAATGPGATMVPGNPKFLSHLADHREYTVERTLKRNLAMLFAGGGKGEPFSMNAIRAPSAMGWACQVGAFTGWSSLPFLPLLDVPTLVMADSDDQIVPPVNAQVLHQAIPDSRIEMFEGGGHLFMLSQQSRFVSVLRHFLDQPSTAKAA